MILLCASHAALVDRTSTLEGYAQEQHSMKRLCATLAGLFLFILVSFLLFRKNLMPG
jgi:hypothetical protein